MKKIYIKPETTVVALNVKESLLEMSLNESDAKNLSEKVNGGDTYSREVLISEETTIIARSAWQSW